MKPSTVAARDAILAALREAWPGSLTTREVCEAVSTSGVGLYAKVYPNLRALNGLGAVNYWPASEGLRDARWALSSSLVPVSQEYLDDLKTTWGLPFPAQQEPPTRQENPDE